MQAKWSWAAMWLAAVVTSLSCAEVGRFWTDAPSAALKADWSRRGSQRNLAARCRGQLSRTSSRTVEASPCSAASAILRCC